MSLESRLLTALSPWCAAPGWCVAFSGGLDSTVLLHLLVSLSRRMALPPLRAVHVAHGLQTAAAAWPAHCQQVCAALGVPLRVQAVQVAPGASLERAAREARYAALADELGAGELLLTAQHLDDQAETLLFRLLRGAGVRGLAGMPASRALGPGHLLRPLLTAGRAELEAYAAVHQLHWVEDPSNGDLQYSRNYLRQQVLPVLQQRWPQAATSMARTAEHLREAQDLLDDLARLDLASLSEPARFAWLGLPSLPLAPLLALSAARQRNLLRYWLAPMTALPDSDHWAGFESLLAAGGDALPVWRLAGGELHRADGRLWWLSGAWLQTPAPAPAALAFAGGELPLPGNGRLRLRGTAPAGVLRVAYRQGGEYMEIAGRGSRDLKRLLNESGLPAFVRRRVPLLLCGERVLAVANLPGLDGSAQGDWQLQWQPPISDQDLS